MTDKDYNEMKQAMKEHREWLLSDKKAAKKYLKELGIWHLSVPIKRRKKSNSAHRKK